MFRVMDWFPIVFIVFKILVLGVGMFLAVKWHYERGKGKGKGKERRATPQVVVKMGAVFVLLLLSVLFVTFFFSNKLGLDLTFP